MKLSFKVPPELDSKKTYVWLASWFGCGFLNPAPGTWGSLGALPFGVAIYMLLGGWVALGIATVLVTVIGFWAADRFDKALGGHDSKMIVIDEVSGQWIALLPTALDPFLVIISFIAFRFFDIVKPWPASYFDQKVGGALGVMMDDVVAGFMAFAFVVLVKGVIL